MGDASTIEQQKAVRADTRPLPVRPVPILQAANTAIPHLIPPQQHMAGGLCL